jgi:tetratricopeptide (TPR) repeat protein
MNSINYLKQAKLADSLGKYKLADNFYEKAVRLAAAPPPGFVPIADATIREAAEAALKAAFESGVEADIRSALLRYGFTEDGIAAIERKLGTLGRMTNVNINTLIGEAGARTIEISAGEIFFKGDRVPLGKMNAIELQNFLLTNREALNASQINKILAALRKRLNRVENLDVTVSQEVVDMGLEARYLRPRPRPAPRPESETPSETPRPSETPSETPSEIPSGEGFFSKFRNRFRKAPKTPGETADRKSKLIKWAKGLGAAALLTFGLFLAKDKLYHSESGKEIDYGNPDWNRLGLPDYKMYNDRMEAGQQQAQEPKALAFIEKHKDNPAIKDQRDWYNLAKQVSKKEGNDPKTVENFANDVIAIIKKSPLMKGFNADRNAPRS